MKKIVALLSLIIFLFLTRPSANASGYCNFSPEGANGQPYGDVTISSNCVIYESVNGTSLGNLTLQNSIITLNSTLVFSPGKQINIGENSILYVNTNGKIIQSGLCIKDADDDGFADIVTLENDPESGLSLTNPITQIGKIEANTNGSCPSGYRISDTNVQNLTIVDADPLTPNATTVATSDRELLRLGFVVGGITDALAAAGDIQIVDKNLLVCNGTSCPADNFANLTPSTGNVYVGGKIGIGITNPAASLSIARGTGYDGTLWISGTNNASHFNYATTEDTYIRGGKTTSAVHINDSASGNIIIGMGGGKVGIGTTTPDGKLEIGSGQILVPLGAATEGNVSYSFTGDKNTGIFSAGAEMISFATAGTEQMRIKTGGDVGIRAQSVLYFDGVAMTGDTYIRENSANVLQLVSGGVATLNAVSGSVGIGTTTPSYKIHVVGTLYAGGSSREYKQNITPLALDPSKIYQLNPVTYDYKPQYLELGKKLSSGRQFGLIAEDVYQVYPELTLSDGTKNVANVDYEKLSVLLLAEMKNQKKEIDSLKVRVNSLEQRLIRLESKQ